MLTWVTGRRQLVCLVCDHRGEGNLIAEITALDVVGLEAVRCQACGSIQLADEPRDFSPTIAETDTYVESGAGIGTIAEIFTGVDHSPSLRFLDVGCNYPFALDLARLLYGWKVVGIEPSPAGRRGAHELDVDVRNEYLTPASELGGEFDLILASEVIEHVTDPAGFLGAIRARLSSSGTLVMTTPAAEVVSADESENDALLAISPGYHVFVASVSGMERLLSRAGFAAWRVERHGGSLRVVAHVTEQAARAPVSFEPVSSDDLERYYEWRGSRARIRSALALGMANRLFRLRVARGEFAGARAVLPRLIRATRARHHLDLRHPAVAFASTRSRSAIPWSVVGSAFSMGMLELGDSGNPERAAEYFSLAERVTSAALAQVGLVDGDTGDIAFQAPYHRALALVQFDPPAAVALAMTLSTIAGIHNGRGPDFVASRWCRIFTELVARGTYSMGSGFDEAVAECAPRVADLADPDMRSAGLDALFSLGMAALQSGELTSAIEWFTVCLERCRALPESGHITGLIVASDDHLAMAHERLLAARAVSADLAAPDLESE
jgi:SAM-dependent methyltransferase